jgi:NDP-sugar pyrophosphorylase family protein
VDAIVMAAGEGRRMRPISERWPKPILPIDGRAVIATLLRDLAEAGIERAFVVTGHLAEQVEELVGGGEAFGLEVRFVRQPSALGSADVVRRGLDAGARPPTLVTAADTVFARGDLRRVVDEFARSRAAGAMTARREPPPDPPHRWALRIERGLVVTPLDDDPGNPLSGAPLWVLGPELVPFLDGLAGPPFELAEALANAIEAGHAVAGVEIGKTRDLTGPVDLIVENFPYLAG